MRAEAKREGKQEGIIESQKQIARNARAEGVSIKKKQIDTPFYTSFPTAHSSFLISLFSFVTIAGRVTPKMA